MPSDAPPSRTSRLSRFNIALTTIAVLAIMSLAGALMLEMRHPGQPLPQWLAMSMASFISALLGLLVQPDQPKKG